MPPQKTGHRLAPAEVATPEALDRAGGRVRPALGADPARGLAAPAGPRSVLAPHPDRLLDPPSPGRRGPEALARGRPLHAAPPRQPRPARPAADPAEVDRFVRDSVAGAYERRRRPLPRRPGLRRALGADVARPGPLRRLGRLRLRPAPPRHLALPRLGHQRLQPQPAVRPVHAAPDRRRPAAETPRSTTGSPPRSTATP